jgi:glycosyltransferase involved in cell wall biosynthesis
VWISDQFTPGLVSVIIPTFNRGELLKDAVSSVLSQTYRPIECIIIDDGSNDNTKNVTESFACFSTDDFSVNYFYQENSGAQVARNRGTMLSTGEFIQYLDSDDILYPDKINQQIGYLNSNPTCDGVFGDWEKGLPENNKIVKAFLSNDLINQFLGERCIANFSFLMRRGIVAKIGPWDESLKRNQEIDFHLRGILAGCDFRYHSCLCGLWRTHEGERIANFTGNKEILQFWNKCEWLLNSNHLLTEERAKIIAKNYFWTVLGDKSQKKDTVVLYLLKVITLYPEIPNLNTRKMKVLRRLLGNKLALGLWYNKSLNKNEIIGY